ncbi:MAG TPA: nucleotidyltransferase domain-containing protein [Ktedonobacteraceae bacterium]|jgi:tRNA nucleotidyltransferase (CCA-adding enzyme)|nr:nucleotidyltransferase domain-containing protein [Ktedonobacteraceae bacterium]
MKDILLQSSLGHAQADSVVQEVISVYETAFPAQIAAYYVDGSYADQTYLATSDIDMVIVFRDPVSLESRQKQLPLDDEEISKAIHAQEEFPG